MRRQAICLIALTFILAQCGGGGGGPDRPDEGTTTDVAGPGADADAGVPPEDTGGGTTDTAVDTPQNGEDTGEPRPDTDTPPEDVPVVPDVDVVGPPPDTAQPCDGPSDCPEPTSLCQVPTCVDGACGFAAKDCDDEDLCTVDLCDNDTGSCVHQPNLQCYCTSDAECEDQEDANQCTRAVCVFIDAEKGNCGFEPVNGACNDNNPCTLGEACQPVDGPRVAVCGGGTWDPCDDANEQTVDWCDPQDLDGDACQNVATVPCPNGNECETLGSGCTGFECDSTTNPEAPVCVRVSRTGSCNDNNYCTVGETCADFQCGGGEPRDCADDDPTTIDSCDELQGVCVHTPNPDLTPCVTRQDCANALGPPTNTCKQYECILEGFCRVVDVPNETSCEDGLYCTANDSCRQGQCIGGPPRDCDDEDPSTECGCDEENKTCVCTGTNIPEWCQALVAQDQNCCEIGSECNDQNECTTDSCLTFVSPTVCTNVARDFCHCDPASGDGGAAACDDGLATTTDTCVGPQHPEFPAGLPYPGYCLHEFERVCENPCTGPDNDAACNDNQKCTLDTCELFDEGEGTYCCEFIPQGLPCGRTCDDDADCSDGLSCTPDNCGTDGTCDLPGPPREDCCTSDAECEEDDNPCTTARCDVPNGTCGFVNNTDGCDDGDICTINDVCADGTCVGTDRECPDDGNDPPCFVGRCDPQDGCVLDPVVPTPEPCRNCTTNPDVCDDGNACTNDVCLPDGRCENQDLNLDADTPACQPLACRDEMDCDDGNPCTTDACVRPEDPDGAGPIVPVSACVYVESAGCDIQDPQGTHALKCAAADECDPLTCITPNAGAFCKNPSDDCPTAYCDAQTGCRFLPTAACPLAECNAANAYQTCWDQSPCTVDECDPVTFQCVPVEERRSAMPADSLYDVCYACETAADCPEVESFDLDDPCVTLECLKPAQFPVGPPPDEIPDTAGVCYARVDEDLHPNRCEDYDLCTIDACVAGGGCTHTPRSADCQVCMTRGDCDDFNPCTEDRCVTSPTDPSVGFRCEHVATPGCTQCQESADCAHLAGGSDSFCDQYFCTGGVCQGPMWFSDPSQGVPACSAADCDSAEFCDLPGYLDVCSIDTGDCLWLSDAAATGCRTPEGEDLLAMCVTIEPCKRPVACTNGQCVYEDVPDCSPATCSTVEDCDDGRTCTVDLCNAGECLNVWSEGCCEQDSDCLGLFDGYDECAVVSCGPDNSCYVVAFRESARCGSQCETNDDCERTCTDVTNEQGEVVSTFCQSFCLTEDECYDWPCSEGACNANGRCVWFDGDCTGCTVDEDCADPDPCTEDTCVDGQCAHNPSPTCAPVSCSAADPCESGDPCVIGTCLDAQCVWFPSPLPGCPGTLPDGF